MRLGKMLSVGEVVEQAPIEEPQAPTESVEAVEKTTPAASVPTTRVESPAEPAVAHAKA
nr:hypothetical protein [Pseudonocardia acaciae]